MGIIIGLLLLIGIIFIVKNEFNTKKITSELSEYCVIETDFGEFKACMKPPRTNKWIVISSHSNLEDAKEAIQEHRYSEENSKMEFRIKKK